MYRQILNHKQQHLLPKLKVFRSKFALAGDTAIALQLGHRRSVDFDFFSAKRFSNLDLYKKLKAISRIDSVLIDEKDEYTCICDGVKLTFLYYPFLVPFSVSEPEFQTAELEVLGALKAYALGRRAKWKDYVDLYFLAKNGLSLDAIVVRAKEIFGSAFGEKNFYQQLAYFDDIDYSEAVEYFPGSEVDDAVVKRYLRRAALRR